DVLDDPDRAAVGLLWIHGAAVGPGPERGAILAATHFRSTPGLAAPEVLVREIGLHLVVRIGVKDRGFLADELAGPVAVQLLVAPVAARDPALLDEDDADRGGAEDRLLLAREPLELLRVAALVGDVLDDPHRALLRVGGVDRLRDDAAYEGGAVLAAHFPFE